MFLRALDITRVKLVIGPSMGAMIAWEWAIEAPDMVDTVVVIAAPLRTSPHQIGLNWLQRRGIELDITEDEVVARVGQMVARGVGMMSYRSPVGLEEKFGREWFKPPGSTLRERGMFNIESWLRHHGRRISTRFDPFTYLLYSRAMDLHDVSTDRGDLVSALNRVTCRTLVIGISSDNLYPPTEVQLGADILEHLGKNVRYEEIKSPNGHDAFLLDTDQIGAFIENGWEEPARRLSVLERANARLVRVGILGAGNVAASFISLLQERRSQVIEKNGLVLEIVGVAEIDRDKQLDPVFERVDVTFEPDGFVERQDLDVIVDLTRGAGALDLLKQAISRRKNIVTPNKVLLRESGTELEWLAFHYGVRVAYHDSIAAGWPLIHSLERPLSQRRIDGMRAVLSSACNVMLELIERGATFGEAFADVVERELTEPDPVLDLTGWDTAQKFILLLTQASGRRYVGRQVETTGIDNLDPALIRGARDLGLRVKLVALAVGLSGALEAVVRPMAVPEDGYLGMIRDENHVVVIRDVDGGETVFLGSGGGALPVATAVLNDVVGLFDTKQSWTGRFPTGEADLKPPVFKRSLVLEKGKPAITAGLRSSGVPLLDVPRHD